MRRPWNVCRSWIFLWMHCFIVLLFCFRSGSFSQSRCRLSWNDRSIHLKYEHVHGFHFSCVCTSACSDVGQGGSDCPMISIVQGQLQFQNSISVHSTFQFKVRHFNPRPEEGLENKGNIGRKRLPKESWQSGFNLINEFARATRSLVCWKCAILCNSKSSKSKLSCGFDFGWHWIARMQSWVHLYDWICNSYTV